MQAISEFTVKNHRVRISGKLRAYNLTEAAAKLGKEKSA